MKYKDFRKHSINRNCDEKYNDYHQYIAYLSKDFNHRCAYCNTKDDIMSQGYVVDHFIPIAAFKDTDMEKLKTDYNNLMYSCPKCNNTKKSQYDGDIHDGTYNNNYFYNPVEVDYNKIFYRDEYCTIASEDKKGRSMIIKLKLFSPVYNLAFLIEEIEEILNKINEKVDKTTDEQEKLYYNEVYRKLSNYRSNLLQIFNCNYYNNSVKNS